LRCVFLYRLTCGDTPDEGAASLAAAVGAVGCSTLQAETLAAALDWAAKKRRKLKEHKGPRKQI
jgi:hypothetical protein